MRLLAIALVCVVAGCSQPAHSAAGDPGKAGRDWPHWRGPDYNGISTETDWLAEWPKDGLPFLWRANVGTGFSSLAVADGKTYTMGRDDQDDVVYCFDSLSGKELWTHHYPCKLVDNLHEGGPAATPTVDGPRVYTVSKEGHLFCLD